MTFYVRNYSSEEKFDIAKFMNYSNGVYDVLNAPFLSLIKQLPTVNYYYVNDGFKEIDLIASDMYGDMFYAYLIQYYNSDFRETFPEGTKLRLFSKEDLDELYYTVQTEQRLEDGGN